MMNPRRCLQDTQSPKVDELRLNLDTRNLHRECNCVL